MFFLKNKSSILVPGSKGGISTEIVYPAGFNNHCDCCPVAVLMHGFISNKRTEPLPSIARALASEGIASILFDFDAHGRSEGRFADMTIESEIDDARTVMNYALSLRCFSKFAFVGHSQGGLIAGMLAGRMENEEIRPECLVQLAPAAVLKDDAIAGRCMNARYDASNPPEYVNVLFHHLGREFILGAQKLQIYETSCKYSGKVCLIHGANDRIVPVTYSEKYNSLYPNSELHIIENEGHMMRRKKSEIIGIATSFLKKCLY